MSLRLEHRHFHDVDLALVGVHVSAELDMMPHVIFQCVRINDIPGLSAFVGDEGDFAVRRFHGILDVPQLGFLFILARGLRFSVRDDWNSECDYGKRPHCCG